MNDRLITLLGALGALLLLVGLLFQPQGDPLIGKPNSEQRGPQGYYALYQWLERSGVGVASFRERLTELDGFHPTDNVMMLTLPVSTTLRKRELAHLRAWVTQGNTLLVMAALNDTPSWTTEVDAPRLLSDLTEITDLIFEVIKDQASEDPEENEFTLDEFEQLFRRQDILLRPAIAQDGSASIHPLLRRVDDLRAVSDISTSKWRVKAPCDACAVDADAADAEVQEEQQDPQEQSDPLGPPQLVLNLAVESSTQAPALWELRQGDGRILISGVSGLFSNRSLGTGGNAQLLTNLIAWHMGPSGQFIVEDMHQGLSVLYDPAAFYQDPRLGYSLLFLLSFWLLYLVGTNNRLAPVVPADASPQQRDYVAAVGGFMSRKLAPADTALLMFERWFEEVDATLGGVSAASQQVWQRLAGLPAVDPNLVQELQQLQIQASKGEAVDLKSLHNQLQQMRNLIG